MVNVEYVLNAYPITVTLNEVKGLGSRKTRFLAALRMTSSRYGDRFGEKR